MENDVKSLRGLVVEAIQLLSDTIIRVEAIRLVLEAHGVSEAEVEQQFQELQRVWSSSLDAALADKRQNREREKLERLRQLLESYEGRKQ